MNNYAGNTPLAEITYKYEGSVRKLYAKLEYYNPSGSIKDRIASFIIDKAALRGELKKGQPIIETTSGNTGIAVAAYGALTKHPVHIFMPDWTSSERVSLMKMYGATVHLISKEAGGFKTCLEKTKLLAEEIQGFRINQFENYDNMLAHYHGTGIELLKDVPDVTDFVSGVGSGGTIMGIGSRLAETNNARIIAIEPDCAQILAGKKVTRQHKIEGIGDDFIPKLIDTSRIDKIIPINDDDAIAMAAKLAKELGLGVGISSGANFLGSVLAAESDKHTVATVFSDDNKKYLSTSLSDAKEASSDMLTAKIELLDLKVTK